jgi:signal recognition particle receptor subunit beta
MQTVKMVVTGPFSSGKTAFIGSVSEIPVVRTERKVSDGTRSIKEQTTVAMDFGRITVDKDLALYLFGTPGQKRFDFMWEILSEGMLGFVVLVDSARPETFREARRILDTFRSYSNTPFIIGANKQDDEDAWPPEDLKIALGLDQNTRVLPCVATQKESVKGILLELLYVILENAAEEAPRSRKK